MFDAGCSWATRLCVQFIFIFQYWVNIIIYISYTEFNKFIIILKMNRLLMDISCLMMEVEMWRPLIQSDLCILSRLSQDLYIQFWNRPQLWVKLRKVQTIGVESFTFWLSFLKYNNYFSKLSSISFVYRYLRLKNKYVYC